MDRTPPWKKPFVIVTVVIAVVVVALAIFLFVHYHNRPETSPSSTVTPSYSQYAIDMKVTLQGDYTVKSPLPDQVQKANDAMMHYHDSLTSATDPEQRKRIIDEMHYVFDGFPDGFIDRTRPGMFPFVRDFYNNTLK